MKKRILALPQCGLRHIVMSEMMSRLVGGVLLLLITAGFATFAQAAKSLDPVPGTILVSDGSGYLLAIHPHTGEQSIVTWIGFAPVLALAPDDTLGFVDWDYSVKRVDSGTGEVTHVATVPILEAPGGIAIEPTGNLLIAEMSGPAGRGSVVRVNSRTGDYQILSTGALMDGPMGIVITKRGEIFVTDGSGLLLAIDTHTGEQSIVAWIGFAPLLALAPDDTLVFLDSNYAVKRVDPATGVVTHVATVPILEAPGGIAIEPTGNLLIAEMSGPAIPESGGGGSVVRVNPRTGDYRILSTGSSTMAGPMGIVVVAPRAKANRRQTQ